MCSDGTLMPMPNTVILGTIALDDIETPFGKVNDVLGGSATYASFAASFFVKPRVVSVIGKDFPDKYMSLLKKKVCTKGIKKEGKTFRWDGYYEFDMNEAKTIRTELNALRTFQPKLPQEYEKEKYVFLANMDPDLQLKVLNQIHNPELVVMDTMNLWIDRKKEQLLKVIKKIDILLLNDGEARQLFETTNLVKAARKALKSGPKAVIIKKGEHGALLFTKNSHFNAPGYPLENIKDPTGCGDVFGGAFIGYLVKTKDFSERNMRRAIIYATAIASINAEGFSLEKLKKASMQDIEERFNEIKEMRDF